MVLYTGGNRTKFLEERTPNLLLRPYKGLDVSGTIQYGMFGIWISRELGQNGTQIG